MDIRRIDPSLALAFYLPDRASFQDLAKRIGKVTLNERQSHFCSGSILLYCQAILVVVVTAGKEEVVMLSLEPRTYAGTAVYLLFFYQVADKMCYLIAICACFVNGAR